jgi:hypothetical protein
MVGRDVSLGFRPELVVVPALDDFAHTQVIRLIPFTLCTKAS